MNVLTISGKAGSGKTTVSRQLSERLGLIYVSMGKLFRELAKERDMGLAEFSKHAEDNKDIDLEIDNKQKKYAKEGNVLIEGRLSAHFIDNADLKVWLSASLEERVKRIVVRENRNHNEVLNETNSREESEKKRYYKYYQMDIDDLTLYDIVINTQKWNVEQIVETIENLYLKLGGN